MVTPTPAQLWFQAEDEHPGDVAARRRRYYELMAEHGLLVPAPPKERA